MKTNIDKLKTLIEKYHKYIEEENFRKIEKLCPDGDIVSACNEIIEGLDVIVFEPKGFNSCGYDLQSYVYTWIDKSGKIDGVVLDVESF